MRCETIGSTKLASTGTISMIMAVITRRAEINRLPNGTFDVSNCCQFGCRKNTIAFINLNATLLIHFSVIISGNFTIKFVQAFFDRLNMSQSLEPFHILSYFN